MDRESLSEWAKDKPLSILQLDPADRAVLKIADERDAIQKKTFTKWVNKHLKKASRRVDDLFEDLRDGHNLLSLLEVLSGEHLPREKGKMRFHMLQNAQMALDFLRYKKIKLVNIRAEDIVDGNPKLTLGLIWTIILHFQIQQTKYCLPVPSTINTPLTSKILKSCMKKIQWRRQISDIVVGQEDNVSARDALLRWARRSTARYPGVRVNDFTGSWRDGLAFSALIHRNRPDLLDWRDARNRRPRERLETAFHVVEKEYGVTRLLDPEDVDTNEPDEKSLITYISSLYDVFPEPPAMHPLFDMESQRRVSEYKELATQFLYWCREKTALLQERVFPTTLIEMKRILSDLMRFKQEEIPPRQRDKQRLTATYKELAKYFEAVGEIEVESELRPEALQRAWQKLLTSMDDRDHILQQEIQKLERFQRLADKVQREIKHTETTIIEIEQRITTESRHIERLHPVDAKNIVEGLETDIRHLEQPIQDLNQDCLILREGRYPQAGDLQKKVTKLHQRWSQLHATFHTTLVQKLSGLRYPIHETTVTKQTRTVMETRTVDTNPYFRDLQEYTEWCQTKLKQLLAADYGNDLPSVQAELESHQHEHKIIDQFHAKIIHAERQQTNFSGDELNLYQQRLSQLQKLYTELLSTSTKRLSDLDALQDFLSSATSELSWLNDREQIEISRDWADKNLDLPAIHHYYENLMSELEKREMHFATILDRGDALLVQAHPASKCIEAHLQALQSQWSWLLQLTLCLEVHLKHATEYHAFYAEIREAESWLTKRDEILNTKFSQSEFTLDQGEQLLRGMQDLREELNAFGESVVGLQERAQTIVPLKQRKQPVNRQCNVQAICAYKQGNIILEKGETCTLLDTSGRVKWRVRSNKNVEGPVPGACLLLPPPDNEAIEAADRLKRLFDRSVALWQKKQLRLRQNMIFATIKVVKGWDFEQFLALGAEQRTAIRRALNDDADKLLKEGDSADPQLRRLRREMDEVNRLFDDFEKRARAEEESKQASRLFTEECITLKTRLEEMARELDHIILSPMPRDLDTLEHSIQIHEDYIRRLLLLEPDLKHLQETFRLIALKTPALKKSLDNLMELWKELNTQSNLHGDRLKLLDGALSGLEENEQVISELEGALSKHYEMPSTPDGLHDVFTQLTKLQDVITQKQPQMDKMNDAADQLGRMGVPTKVLNDLKRLHTNVERLNTRWNNICGQIADRLRSCEAAIGLMKNLKHTLQVEETWVESSVEKLQAMPTATSARELDNMLGQAIERTPKIEQVNLTGGRLIREAKIYDGKCLHYVDWLVEARPSFSPPRHDLRPTDKDPGATEVYSQRLDKLNINFEKLLEMLSKRLRTAIEVNGSEGLRFAESYQKPLRTYRVEFNLGGPSGDVITPSNITTTTDGFVDTGNNVDNIYTTSYTSSSFSTSKNKSTSKTTIYSSSDDVVNREGSPLKKVTDTNNQSPNLTTQNGSSVHFSEIKSTKRIERANEGVGTDLDQSTKILETPGIKDPVSGRILTVAEAIHMRLLDVRTGEIIIISTGERIPLSQAVEKNLIEAQLADQLLQPSVVTSVDGRPLSLLQVIQREILEAEHGYDSTERRIKVTTNKNANTTTSTSSTTIPHHQHQIQQQQHQQIISSSITGDSTTSVKIKSNALSLSDAICHGLVDTSGWVTDRNSGDTYRLDSAITQGLIDPDIREVVDAKNDEKVTVKRALDLGILNAKTGRYIHAGTREKLTFGDARQRQLIVRPMTLKDVCDFNLLDKSGRIVSPTRRQRLTIDEAIVAGVLDSNTIQSVTHKRGEQLLTLDEALSQGIVLGNEACYRDCITNEIISIPEAVDRGLISSVSQKSIFNIDGFKDPHSGDFVSLNTALTKNLLIRKAGEFKLDAGKGLIVELSAQGVETGLVRPEVFGMLSRKIGIFDPATREELSVLELVYHNLIDPRTGYLLDPLTNDIVPLDSAIERKMITPEGALLLSSLLNITLTTETVTKTVKRYVTITNTGKEENYSTVEHQQEHVSSLITFTEAVRQGWIDERTQTFTDPQNKEVYSIQQALNYGLIAPDTEVTPIPSPRKSTITIVTKQIVPDAFDKRTIERETTRRVDSKQNAHTVVTDFLDMERQKGQTTVSSEVEKQILELPPEGWWLAEAISQQFFDPITGLFIIPGTDRLVSFEECINLQIINPGSVAVIDPTNGRKINVSRAIEKHVIDSTGKYRVKKNKKPITMKEAIESGKIILESPSSVDTKNQRLIQIIKVTGKPIRVEVSNRLDDNPPTFVELKSANLETLSPEPLQVAPGIIYDPTTALVIFTETGRSENVLTAIIEGKIDPSVVKILDPATGKEIRIDEALQRGIINSQTGEYQDPVSGKKLNLIDAAKLGVLAIAGIPLVAAAGAIHALKMYKDPKTGNEIPIELACERGLITREDMLMEINQSDKPRQSQIVISNEIIIKDPKTGREMNLVDAVDQGLVSIETAESLTAQIAADPSALDTIKYMDTSESISLTNETRTSEGERTRERITTHPKYKVAIGRAKSFSQSPERDAKPVVLQKIRKKIVRPKAALERGMIDQETIELIQDRKDSNGEVLTLSEAIAQNKLPGDQGRIIDPQRGDVLTISQAIDRGILDGDGTQLQLLVPLATSLSIPKLKDQGLIDPNSQKIVHPETGVPLSLGDAIVCDIVDPLSKIIDDNQQVVTLQEAIDNGFVKEDQSKIQTRHGSVDLLTAVAGEYFAPDIPVSSTLENIPPVGMTFSVAIRRGLVDVSRKEIHHPITGERIPIKKAIDENFIMAVPYPPSADSVEIDDALNKQLIDSDTGTFTNPTTGDILTINEAIETGQLVIKPLPNFIAGSIHSPTAAVTSVTETVTSYHTITTKTIELLTGYVLLSAQEVQNQQTGEIMSVEEAKQLGIVKDESERKEKFATREIKLSFADAIRKGLVDITKGTYTDPNSGAVMPISQAVDDGFLGTEEPDKPMKSTELGRISEETETTTTIHKMTLIEAYETIYDEKTQMFRDPQNPERLVTLDQAMHEGIVDPESIVVDIKTGEAQTLKDGVKTGLIDAKTGDMKQQSGKGINVKQAAKMGLLAIVGAPVLAGMAVADAVKKAVAKKQQDQDKMGIQTTVTTSTTTTTTTKGGKKDKPQIPDEIDYADKHDKLVESLQTSEKPIDTSYIEQKEDIVAVQKHEKKEKSPEKHVTFLEEIIDRKTEIENEKISSKPIRERTPPDIGNIRVITEEFKAERMPLGDAIAQRKIEPKICRIITDGKEMPLTVQDALDQHHINLFCIVDILMKNVIALVDTPNDSFDLSPASPSISNIDKMLPRDMSLEEAIRTGIIDAESAVSKDPSTGKFKILQLSINEGIIDPLQWRATIDPKSSFFIFGPQRIIYTREPISFDNAVESQTLDLSSGRFTDPSRLENVSVTLKEAIGDGHIDPDSALVKDGSKKRLVRLPDAFRRGLVDADKANVLDTTTSKLQTLQAAVDSGLLATPRRSFGLLEALSYNLYNPTTGGFSDPFVGAGVIDRKRLTLANAIANGLIDPSTTMVRDSANSTIVPLVAAISNGLVDATAGRLVEPESKHIDLVKAYEKGHLLPAEQRQAVIEKFALCEDNLANLLKWISGIEQKLASIGGPKERIDDLRNQINVLKQIKDDIDSQARVVSSCLEQVRQLVLTGGDVLSAPEVAALENSGRELRSRVDRSQDRTGKLLKKLESARDELRKLRSELDIFSGWLQTARRTLEDKERALSDLSRLSTQTDSIKEFVSDVIAHQADLRFIAMSAQKFVDESKEFLGSLNDFRTTLPDRLPHIEPLASSESPIRQEVTLVQAQYRDLLHRANALSDRLSGLGGRQRDYQDALEKARSWLRTIQPRVIAVLSDPIAADPQTVQDQMTTTKQLHSEYLSQGRLIDNLQQSVDSLLKSIAGELSPSEVTDLEAPVEAIKSEYVKNLSALADRCQLLDTALVQSQGVQDALDSLFTWMNQSEQRYSRQQLPASLIREKLLEQVREHRAFLADLESHRPSIDSVTITAKELIATASNARIAKNIEKNLKDLTGNFDKLLDKSLKRAEFLDETLVQLTRFLDDSSNIEQKLCNLQELLDSRDINSLVAEDLASKIAEMVRTKESLRPAFEDCVRSGKDLSGKRDVTDTGVIKDRVRALENQWKSLGTVLEEKTTLSRQKAEQLNAYETLRDQALAWLSSIELRTNNLVPVAVDPDIIRQQTEEVKPLIKEHRDYGPNIDRVNDVGQQYDDLIRPDSPSRKQSGRGYSPIKRTGAPIRRLSGDRRSPSPTKGIHSLGQSPTGTIISPLSPGGSSGFGSRRSSQDGFQLGENSPIRQQLTEINNRYKLIGVRLTDRQSELENVKEEVRKHLESLRSLSTFLDRVQRQVPRDSISTKDEAERCTKQARKVLEEMYEKQSQLDSTKAQVKDLLRRKPDVQGAERLRNDLEGVSERWRQLNELCKDRITFSEQLRDFLDTHDNLNSWLTSKEKMLTVLGPISSDPRMVQSQVQQVQVLREEFRSQQPQLQHLQDVARAVISTPEGPAVDVKLRAVQSKWDDIVGRLDERAQSLGAAADTSKEFDASLSRLRDALQTISDNLDGLPTDRDHQETLRKIENLERQLEGQRPLLADAEASATTLCNVLGDPASRADVNARVTAVGKQYQALQRKLDTRKAETESALRDGRQFGESCARMLGWLSGELSNLSDRLLVSAHRPTLQHQIETHEPVYREVMAREHEIIMLLNKGREMQDSQTQRAVSADRQLQRDIDKIGQQWEKLRRDAVDRHTRLQTCMEHCRKYGTASEAFLTWLRSAEDKLSNLKPGVLRKQQLDQQLRELQTFRSEIWKRSGEYESTRGQGEAFLGACDVDKEPVKAELNDMRERWERLNNELVERGQALDTCAKRLTDFNDELRNLDHAVGRCEDRLGAHDALGAAAKDPKLLERVRTIREDANALRKPLQATRKLADDIAVETRSVGGDADHLKSEVDAVADRIDELHALLDDRCGELQSAATAVSQFNEQVKGLAVDLNDLEHQVDTLAAPAREIKTVIVQIDEVGTILNKIDRAADRVGEVEKAGECLVDNGFAPDTLQTREQVAGLRKTLGRLENRTKDHEDALQRTLKGLEKFYDVHTAVLDDLTDVSDQMRQMKPIGSELEQIRNQQDDFRRFRQHTIEPLSQNISEVNRLGQDLVRSAQSGVSTTQLEKDLEKMNEKWNNLKEKMNDRDRRLDVGLLQSGKFQEALDGLSKWLSDTEEMVANQKPPSSDYKVVKAQLQEQEFLQKMLLDRQNSMSSLFSLGQEVAAGCEPAEKAAIEKQLRELMGRFDNLTDSAKARKRDLEEAMDVAKLFQDKYVPLSRWLETAERQVKSMELVPTDEEKIQERIEEHNDLHHDILSHQPAFSQLTDIAGQLMGLVGEDEGVGLSEKVQVITERYTTLVEASEAVGNLLGESRQGLRHLVLTYQELVAWMEQMDVKLAKHRIIPVHTDKILEKMDQLVELNVDIASRAENVESTVEIGSELMKHITADEALQLKDKLDSLQRRYGDLTQRGGDLLKQSQSALPLVQQFHESHNRLVDWMQGAEGALATGEPRETDILRLESELSEMRPIIETVNSIGPQLCQISPGEGASTIESLVSRDNRRFDAIVEQIQRKAERLHLSKLRSKEVTGDIDELLEWFRDMDASLRDADAPGMDPKLVRAQLQEHRSINDDIAGQKGRVRDVTAAAKKVLRETHQPSNETTAALREKLDDLKEVVEIVVALCSERLAVLEQALPLSEHFAESHTDLVGWLDDMERQISMLSMPALRPDQIASQQDKNERLVQSISEHKPLLDKLNKTGEALASLVADDDASKIQDILDADNSRYAALRTELRERQLALDKALQESSQFSDKLEGMLRALANTADQVNQSEPISAHPPRIRDQIEENAGLVDDLEKRTEAYAAVKRAANDVISKAVNQSDPAVRDIKKKLDQLNQLWNDVQKATSKRGNSLDNTLACADKFWRQLDAIMQTLRDLQETLTSQEPPAAQPQEIQKQQVALQEIRHEIDQTKPEVEEVRRTGSSLMSLCGEPDKPEVKKHIEDLDHAWDNITALYAKREENLIDAMEKAMEFHETLQNLLKFLTKAEDRFNNLGPVGSDIEAVKRQIEQLKHFKDDVDPHMVEIEALNRQAIELTERTSAEQATAIREPLNAVNRRWENLLRGLVERQKQLEHALLHLGQFQHALNELLIWISKTDSTLDQLKPIPGDPQILEVELAKLKVLANDIQAHKSSVDTLNDAGRQLIETDRGSVEASTTQEKLNQLNQQWRGLLQKASDRQHELEEALREAQGFTAEIQDLLGWLGDVDGVIGASKPVGGLPETASEQLERFMEVYNELEDNRAKVETLLAQGQDYIKRQGQMNVTSSNLQHILRTLKQRWDAVISRASDKKIKLEIALKEATEFHDALQAFVEWLTSAEKQLVGAAPVSRVLETIQGQIEEHKILQKDVSIHRESMLLLDKKGTHLKYFSQKQDVILIKNLLVSVQHRWERVVAKAAERTRALDHGYKEAREFHDAWQQLIVWLEETETTLDTLAEEAAASNDPAKIKRHLEKLRETQRNLSAKQSVYDNTMRAGKSLTDRAPKSDEVVLFKMVTELKETWTRVCTKSVDRQRKLEEALLLSGQFSEALQALLDFLKKAHARLTDDGPVHGDLDTVTTLVDQHRTLESDLEKRAAQMQSVLKNGRELERSGDSRDISQNLDQLQGLWDTVTDLCSRRGVRLQDALHDAERLHKQVHMLLEWLSEAEQKLRFAVATPDDEAHARELVNLHTRFLRELREKEQDKDETLRLAQNILNKAHPDAVPIIKNWITIIQSRWEEVSQWAISRETKLQGHLQALRDLDESIEELLAWLAGLEATLTTLEREPLPDEISILEQLITDHREFMENTAKRQTEVDRACKLRQPAAGTQVKDGRKPSRMKTPVRGSSQDLREHSPDYNSTMGRKQSFKGSRDTGLNARRTSRASPGRGETPERDRLPHYGPRFTQSSHTTEMEFRSTRARLLWDKWRHVWMMAWERQRRLHDHLIYLQDVERVRQFSWDDWRKRFLKFMNHKKSRLTDLFRKMDKDNNGLIPREVFIDGIINTKFDTSRLEMGAVADLFDRNGDGLIDWQEFIAALRPDWQERKPDTDADKIHDEVKRLVMLCTCRQKFRVFQVGEGKYRFGDSQKLRLVRILRSTVMVRVGGGWVALDEFLVKNDPCRVALVLPLPNPNDPNQHEACCPLSKGRTNIELREQFILADGVSQSMAAFKPRMSGSSGSGRQNGGTPGGGSVSGTPPRMSSQGPITKVRERSQRSVAMSRPSRSSLSASTPDSLSDNESSLGGGTTPGGRFTPRKPSLSNRTTTTTTTTAGRMTPGRVTPGRITPVDSRSGSKPNSRPVSRAGSKPPSRHGSTLSLDSTDDTGTPTRIPMRRPLGSTSTPSTGGSASGSTPRPSRLSVGTTATGLRTTSTTNGGSRPRTPSGSASPAQARYGIGVSLANRYNNIAHHHYYNNMGGMNRSSSIPTLVGNGVTNNYSTNCSGYNNGYNKNGGSNNNNNRAGSRIPVRQTTNGFGLNNFNINNKINRKYSNNNKYNYVGGDNGGGSTSNSTTTTTNNSSSSNCAGLDIEGRTISGSSTPSGMQTPRKSSMDPPPAPTGLTPAQRKARAGTPEHRAPFRL